MEGNVRKADEGLALRFLISLEPSAPIHITLDSLSPA